MKKIALALLGATLLSAPATASDLFGGSTKDPVTTGPSSGGVVNWTGFYIGGSVGYGNANHDLSLHESFKNFCYDGDPASLNPFEDSNHGRPAKEWTLDTKNEYFEQSAASCEQLDIDGDGGQFQAGDYVTVPGDSREIARLDGMNTDGVIGDARVGFDWARGRFLFGLFGSYTFSNMEGEASLNLGPVNGHASLEKGDEWAVGGRIGYIVAPRTMAYVLAAYTQTDYDLNYSGSAFGNAFSGGTETNFDGISVGGGVEFAMTSNIFLGVEYQHTFYGEETIWSSYDKTQNAGLRIDDDLDEDRVMLTLKAKLNGGLFGGF